jgi:hypothetical protein
MIEKELRKVYEYHQHEYFTKARKESDDWPNNRYKLQHIKDYISLARLLDIFVFKQ